MTLAQLPRGIHSFSELRSKNDTYVDKTEQICTLATQAGKFFVSRPRGFGKSLLISTLASLFSQGLKDFQGLAIETLWHDTTYKVITMDFSLIAQYESVQEFETKFYGLVFRSFKSLGFNPVESNPSIAMFELEHWLLKEQPVNSIVLLINEYDSPLPAVRQQKVGYESVDRLLRSFYAMLKSCDAAFRFIFITGETPFNTTNIFESFNSLQDISSSANYATVLGVTKVELVENFQPCLSLTAAHHHLSLEELLERMREYNDEGSATQQIYSPQSVLSFLATYSVNPEEKPF